MSCAKVWCRKYQLSAGWHRAERYSGPRRIVVAEWNAAAMDDLEYLTARVGVVAAIPVGWTGFMQHVE